MRAERYDAAWALERQAIAARDPGARDDPALPYHLRWVWDGQPVDGRDVLVRCYHGLGDTIQFARFLPALAARARSLTVEAQPRLVPLLAPLVRGGRIVPFDLARPLPPAECDLEIGELPGALRLPPAGVPSPYLRWPAAAMPPDTIGLCYAAGDWDGARSIPAELFRPIADRFRCVTLVAEETSLPVANPAGCPLAMDATAALVAGAALIVTVDTMIAHLAGAMGRPVWLLLKSQPDWRWTPGRRDTPWYPTMRLYHQAAAGEWAPVLAALAADLAVAFPACRAAHP